MQYGIRFSSSVGCVDAIFCRVLVILYSSRSQQLSVTLLSAKL